MECVGLAVLGDLPAMRQVGDDRLAAVARVAPDQVVEHASLGAQVEDGSGLVHIEMRWPQRDAQAQDAPGFGIGLGSGELKFRAIELVRYLGGMTEAPGQSINAGHYGSAALQKAAARPPWASSAQVAHTVFSPSMDEQATITSYRAKPCLI